MNNQQRLAKNESIRKAMQETHNKRKNQICKTYKVKVDYSALNSIQKEQLTRIFLEAKWLWNDILNWSNLEDRDIHSAKNMIWLKNNVGVGRTNVKRVELEALLNTIFSAKATETMKHEANTL